MHHPDINKKERDFLNDWLETGRSSLKVSFCISCEILSNQFFKQSVLITD